MHHIPMGGFSLRKTVLAALLTSGLGGISVAAPAPATTPAPTKYSVINIDPEGGAISQLNEQGQVAYGSFVFGNFGFFDGDRLHDVGYLNGSYNQITGLNNKGVVTGDLFSIDPLSDFRVFKWTVAGGLRLIPDSEGGLAEAINDNGQVVGSRRQDGISARATRFDPDGRILSLGTSPLSLSEALAVNNQGVAGGFADVADGSIHATVWANASKATDLGTLGGFRAFTEHVNERGDAAGFSDNATNDNEVGFFWSLRDGIVPTGAQGFEVRLASALNDLGEIAGVTDAPGRSTSTGYLWSRARGLALLPLAGNVRSDVLGLNNKTEIVGGLERADGSYYAALWRGLSNPVDLTPLLHRPPAGLALIAGIAINEAGTILAYSNAGLVLLRPGAQGTDAPVLGPLAGLPFSAEVGQDLHLTLGFTDNSPTQTHTAAVEWTDGCATPAPVLTEAGGVGQVAIAHRFCGAGYYLLTVRVRDSGDRTTETHAYIDVVEPDVTTIAGRGTLATSVSGVSGVPGKPVHFTFWAPGATATGAAAGAASARPGTTPFIHLDGPFRFRSDQVGTPTRTGATMRLSGTGHLNGRAGYRFLVDATDNGAAAAGGGDRLRLRIVHTGASGAEVVDYDNGASVQVATAATPVTRRVDRTLLASGDIALHN